MRRRYFPVGAGYGGRVRGAGSPHFRADVEGLRAVAVVAVVLFHAGVPGTSGGFVGVDVFFVLSGFLITGLLRSEVEATGRVDFARFYARRVRRLLPAAAFVILATLLASAALLSPLRATDVAKDGAASALYAANYRFATVATDYFAATEPSPLLHFWSLAVEEQFYVVWPLLLAFVAAKRRAAALAAVVVVSFAACVWLTQEARPWAFFSLPTRAWELGAGGLVALAAPRLTTLRPSIATALGWLGLAGILAAVVTYDERTVFPGPAAALPVLGTAAVVVAGCAATRYGVATVLGRTVPRAIGRLSYSWYLWHFPVLVLAEPTSTAMAAALALGTLVPAALTLRFVENPVRFSARLTTRRSLALGAALTAVAAVAAFGTIGAVPEPKGTATAAPAPVLTPAPKATATLTEKVRQAVATAARSNAVPENLTPSLKRARRDKPRHVDDGCHLTYDQTTPRRCVYGDVTARDAAFLTGDSHAAQWFPAVEAVAETNRWRLHAMTKSTCPPIEVDVFSPVLGRDYRECAAFRANVLELIRTERPKVVVLGVARHYEERLYGFAPYGPEWLAGLRGTVTTIEATGAQVVVLGPTARTRGNVPDCLADHLDRASACTRDAASAFDPSGIDHERAAVTEAGGTYLDARPWLCADRVCPVIVGTMLVYRDDNHLSTAYPAWLAPVVGEGIGAALQP